MYSLISNKGLGFVATVGVALLAVRWFYFRMLVRKVHRTHGVASIFLRTLPLGEETWKQLHMSRLANIRHKPIITHCSVFGHLLVIARLLMSRKLPKDVSHSSIFISAASTIVTAPWLLAARITPARIP